jgi:hypothetical protein
MRKVLLFTSLLVVFFLLIPDGSAQNRRFKSGAIGSRDTSAILRAINVKEKRSKKGEFISKEFTFSFKGKPTNYFEAYYVEDKKLVIEFFSSFLDTNLSFDLFKGEPFVGSEMYETQDDLSKILEGLPSQMYDVIKIVFYLDREISYNLKADFNMFILTVKSVDWAEKTKERSLDLAKRWVPIVAIAGITGGIIFYALTRKRDDRFVN